MPKLLFHHEKIVADVDDRCLNSAFDQSGGDTSLFGQGWVRVA